MAAMRLPRFTSSLLRTTQPHRLASTFSRGPAPPRLPKEEQDRFEKLQAESRGAFSSAGASAGESSQVPAKPEGSSFAAWRDNVTTVDKEGAEQRKQDIANDGEQVETRKEIETGTGAELHPHMRRGAKPEFEGDINPKTGEVGGPKNEPMRWGSGGDYSYNGRCTDF